MKADGLGMGSIILTVYCGQCAEEGRRHPGNVGHVAGWWAGLLWWGSQTRERPRRPAEYEALDSPVDKMPPRLPAFCPRHGSGGVETSAVMDATRAAIASSAATVVLPFSA